MGKLHLITVHGISNAIIKDNYAATFEQNLRAKLTEQGVLPKNPKAWELAETITFDWVNYSDIGQSQEDKVLTAYEADKDKLYNPLDKAIDAVAFNSIRREVITSISDVLIYESDYWRDRIRKRVLNKITPYVGTNTSVTVVAHSLGSVVAFDVLYYESRKNPSWKAAGFKVTNFFTLGSPIALFSLELQDDDGRPKPRYTYPGATPPDLNPLNTNLDLQPNHNDGVWYNFLDAQDLIGYPLEKLYASKFNVKDILVQTGTNPLNAHSRYWYNDQVTNMIAERLKLDYERLNKSSS